MDMEDTRDDAPSEHRPRSAKWRSLDFIEKFGSVSLDSKEEILRNKESTNNVKGDRLSCKMASQILWSTGMLSEPIPNGFYYVVPEKKLKELYEDIPTLEELQALELEGLRAEVILVDAVKDKKLSLLKQLIEALVKGLNPAAMIKKIAELVSDVYGRSNSTLSPKKTVLEDTSHISENQGVQMLSQIKHGSCRPRAILFKVLADTVGLENTLVVGLPTEGDSECVDSYKHMSVLVVLNSVELLVDLMRFPGQLIPRSTKAIFMTHISAAGESDSAENESCDSPMGPNSPLYGVSETVDPMSAEKEDGLLHQRTLEASSNTAGPSLRNMMLRSNSVDRKLNLPHSEPNIAATFWRRGRRQIIPEQRTASSSPEHPSFQARGRSMLSGDNKSFRDYSNEIATSRSEGASAPDTRRTRRRSISMTPEIGDDIVRAVRAMNESLKQNRLLKEQQDISLYSFDSADQHGTEQQKDDKMSGGRSSLYAPRRQNNSQKALSLPSSPHDFSSPTPERIETHKVKEEMVSAWNRVLGLPMFQNKPLLPFEEWNIDFSELTVGTRVGIGFFGEVFRGVWNGTEVAIKVFLEQDLTVENMEDFCNEISILSRLRHPNVILFLGACTMPPRLSMVTEYMERGSLYYLIHLSDQKNKLTWRRRIKMLRDICRGLMCIHRMKIVHRDLKSANCLVNKHWTVKICDFGLSRIMTDATMRDSSSAGTPEWMAPELIRNEPFTVKCDIFSLGIIMWELCTLNKPWDGIPPERVVYAVANEGLRLEIPEGPLGRLIADCWAEPDERPSCEEILPRLLDCELSLC
ncbi:serine/threonine-protein kinase EDR1-like isoform X1 [Olea europaea var. sylvestris]|uniref:serine/threonine-protein kinase EDR1-like isoform X1 n=1 Tax=Olea europaea var. sylvestris TaxID=158386 RepID=UPI000C1D6697|nr:serine/threonine-protein kinase EDR1-like isoform X1 [Olea europaea var. sylvestris]XP_022870732.1 serine/threonine-protein kinase EDR1-like isoform X1 [Olea europaea var. sylvestris]